MSALVDNKTDDWNEAVESDASVGAEEEIEDAGSDSDVSADEGGDDVMLTKGPVVAKKEAAPAVKKQLSKAEKAALKAKELAEMDDIFSEMGIELNPEAAAAPAPALEPVAVATKSDKDKQKKKKKKAASKPKAPEPVEAEAVPLTEAQIKAKLAAKLAAKKPVLTAAQKAAADNDKGKKKVFGNYDL